MDVEAAYTRIRDQIPNARWRWYDYDQSLAVAHPTRQEGYIVYQVERAENGQPEVVGDISAIIAKLKS